MSLPHPRPATALGYNAASSAGATSTRIPRRSIGSSAVPLPRPSGSSQSSVLATAGVPSATPSTQTPVMPAARHLKRSFGAAGLATPATATKRCASTLGHNSMVPSTPSSNLLAFKADVSAASSASALQRQLISAQRENAHVLRDVAILQERVKHLETERSILLAREDKSLTTDSVKAEQQERDKREQLQSLAEYRSRCAILEENVSLLTAAESKARHAQNLAQQEKDNIDRQMQILQDELVKLEGDIQQNGDETQQLHDAQLEIEMLKADLVKARTRDEKRNEDVKGSPSTADVLRKELHHQVTHLKTLEHNNARLNREIVALRTERQSLDLLKEQKLSLETKLLKMNELRSRLARTEAEVESLQNEKRAWAAFLAMPSSTGNIQVPESPAVRAAKKAYSSSPAQITKTLASARIEIVSLQDKQASLQSAINARDESIIELERRIHELEAVQIKQLRADLDRQKTLLLTKDRNAKLDEKEISMLRAQLATYTAEESMLPPSVVNGQELPMYDQQKNARISQLEELVDAHKTEAHRAVKEAERLRGLLEVRGDDTAMIDASAPSTPIDERTLSGLQPPGSHSKQLQMLSKQMQINDEVSEALRSCKAELAEAELEIESLEAQNDALSHALGRGEFDKEANKILTLARNPAAVDLAVRTETLERLKDENQALLHRLQRLEEHNCKQRTDSEAKSGSSDDTVPPETLINMQAELKKAQDALEQERKSRSRLKEIFQRTAQEVRESVRQLLGYKLEPTEDGRIKLTSTFGAPDHTFIFGPSTDSTAKSCLRLIGGSEVLLNSARVQQGVQFSITERNCIPLFLAQYTVEVYEESTRGRGAGWVT